MYHINLQTSATFVNGPTLCQIQSAFYNIMQNWKTKNIVYNGYLLPTREKCQGACEQDFDSDILLLHGI